MARNFVKASSQFLEVLSAPVPAVPMSIACWFRATTDPQVLIALEQSASQTRTILYAPISQSVQAFTYDGVTVANPIASAPFTTGVWTHGAAVFPTASSRSAYINGANKVSDNATVVSSQPFDRLSIGRMWAAGVPALYSDADIAEAAIWNVALTDIDVAVLAAGLSPLLVRPESLVFYAPLGVGSPEPDLVGRRNLTVNGATVTTHPRIYRIGGLAVAALPGYIGFSAVSSIGFSTAAALNVQSRLAASTGFGFSTASTFAAAAFASTSTIGVAVSAALTATARFAATSTIAIATSATFAAVRFAASARIALATAATLTRSRAEELRASEVRILLAGVEARTRVTGLTIRDVLNDAPNTCGLTIDGVERPINVQRVRVLLDRNDPRLLFNGNLQHVDMSYEGWPPQRVYPCTATDDTAQANRRRPFGTWTNVSATIFAQQLIAQFAPAFTTAHVQPGLPPVTITLDGTEGMSAALKQAATQIGGYFYFLDGDLHLFIEETIDNPDPIDGSPGRLLAEPPIRVTRDDSQLRTRQCGRAHGEPLLADIAAGESILPVANVSAWFGTPGSERRAIALSQRLRYAGVQDSGGGSLVGPGASPVVAPSVTAVVGAGLPNGVLRYAFSFVTAAGESLVGPLASITAGPLTGSPVANPTTAPSIGTAKIGAGVDAGAHQYAVSWLTAAGETLAGPTAAVTVGAVATPVNPPPSGMVVTPSSGGDLPWDTTTTYRWYVTFVTASGETTVSPGVADHPTFTPRRITISAIPIGPPGTLQRRIYLAADNVSNITRCILSGNASTSLTIVSAADYNANFLPVASLPSSNTAGTYPVDYHVIPLAGIPTGPAGVTGRNIYRSVAGGSALYLAGTLANNSATTFEDAAPDNTLGGPAPASNTTAVTQNLNAATVAGIALGPGTVTARRIYRTTAGGSQLKLLQTIANNTATVGANDTAADGTLGANAPIADTSGLVGVGTAGAVLPGATSLLTSGAGPFPIGGGWVTLSGNQLVRYTGITGNTLTGIPASGVGSLITTVLYGSQVLPAPALIGVTSDLLMPQAPPFDGTLAVVPGAGVDDGVHSYAVTYGKAGVGETLPSMVATITTGGGNNQVIVPAAVMPYGADYRNVYRTKAGGSQLFYRGTANVAFVDAVADSGLNAAVSPPTVDTLGLRQPIALPILKGTPISVWVQRDDPGAQAEQAAIDIANGVGNDGIYEGPPIIDERRNEASIRIVCDATLAIYARPIVTVTYDCRDVKTKSGATVVIDLDEPAIHETLTIQEVTITEIDIAPGLLPRFSVVASSTRFSLDDIIRRLLTATDSVTSA